MTNPILINAERDREAAAIAQTESYAEARARRRAERIAAKLFARARIAALIGQPTASP